MNHHELCKDWEDDGKIYTCRYDFRTTVMVMKDNPTIISINGIHVPYSDDIIRQVNAMVKP
jgi:hypothetical protein